MANKNKNLNYTFTPIYRPVAKEFFNLVKAKFLTEKNGGLSKLYIYKKWPREDSFCFSKNFPIFCVADGVTLDPKIENGYPNPSGAFLVADAFAKNFVVNAEKNIKDFNLKKIKDSFLFGNSMVEKINKKYGRVKNKINYLDFDLFAATAGLAVISDDKLFWGTIADSFVAVFDKNGVQKFCSPDGWRYMHLPKNLTEIEKKIYIRKKLRNGIQQNEKIGYGVITGEKSALRYLDYGQIKLISGDTVLIGTDGYADYLNSQIFIKTIIKSEKDINSKLLSLEKKLINTDAHKYGHERTLIIVKISQALKN